MQNVKSIVVERLRELIDNGGHMELNDLKLTANEDGSALEMTIDNITIRVNEPKKAKKQ